MRHTTKVTARGMQASLNAGHSPAWLWTLLFFQSLLFPPALSPLFTAVKQSDPSTLPIRTFARSHGKGRSPSSLAWNGLPHGLAPRCLSASFVSILYRVASVSATAGRWPLPKRTVALPASSPCSCHRSASELSPQSLAGSFLPSLQGELTCHFF